MISEGYSPRGVQRGKSGRRAKSPARVAGSSLARTSPQAEPEAAKYAFIREPGSRRISEAPPSLAPRRLGNTQVEPGRGPAPGCRPTCPPLGRGLAASGLPRRGCPEDHGPASRDLGFALCCFSRAFLPRGRSRCQQERVSPGELTGKAAQPARTPAVPRILVRTRSAGSSPARSAGPTASYKV